MNHLMKQDPAIAQSIQQELRRQRDKIELIASENFLSGAVLEAMGSPVNVSGRMYNFKE
ncbi:hypothetical protein GCM10008018_10500 [Paenibacillus marchantiophytorum]|uniref:Serine hydroxymethyltransferase-like domain-containing protein n=1 Tax=Paenibacillus marchantiophytorum TaxID=1619310 RepID=A0ABQ2BQC5_9BACL|nr:hypothetical protein GCM10008018_10500 [Paenibacillus marchantiophytorum]